MKLIKLFIASLVLLLCACSSNPTGKAAEEVVFPFEDLKTAYSTGEKNWEVDSDNINGSVAEVLEEISNGAVTFSSFINDNAENIDSGKNIYELSGFEDSAKDLYEVGCKLSNIDDSSFPEEYAAVKASLVKVGNTLAQTVEEMYFADPATATDLCAQLSVSLTTHLQELPSLFPVIEVEVAVGETVTEQGFADITIKEISYRTEVYPSDTSGVYTYYSVNNENNSYLAIRFDFTNLQTTAGYTLNDYVKFVVEYDGGYQYAGWSIAEEGGMLSSYPNLIPLSTFDSWYLIEVPNRLKDVAYKLVMVLGNSEYTIITK